MADEDDLERRLRQLEHDHRLTRWYTGRIDRDLAEIATTQQEHTELLRGLINTVDLIATTQQTSATQHQGLADKADAMETQLLGLAGKADSTESQLRSLTQLVGEVLRRLPNPDDARPEAAEDRPE